MKLWGIEYKLRDLVENKYNYFKTYIPAETINEAFDIFYRRSSLTRKQLEEVEFTIRQEMDYQYIEDKD